MCKTGVSFLLYSYVLSFTCQTDLRNVKKVWFFLQKNWNLKVLVLFNHIAWHAKLIWETKGKKNTIFLQKSWNLKVLVVLLNHIAWIWWPFGRCNHDESCARRKRFWPTREGKDYHFCGWYLGWRGSTDFKGGMGMYRDQDPHFIPFLSFRSPFTAWFSFLDLHFEQ